MQLWNVINHKNKAAVFTCCKKKHKKEKKENSNVFLPFSHITPVHPTLQPPSHWPVIGLQVTPSLQCPEHWWLQLRPYHPFVHSGLMGKVNNKNKHSVIIIVHMFVFHSVMQNIRRIYLLKPKQNYSQSIWYWLEKEIIFRNISIVQISH